MYKYQSILRTDYAVPLLHNRAPKFPDHSIKSCSKTDVNTKTSMAGDPTLRTNKTLGSVHFGVVVVELINCKCGGIVRNEIW